MADAFVFNLMTYRNETQLKDLVLRYAYDERCIVERGDVWERTDENNVRTRHRTFQVRVFEGVNGTEYHSFLLPEHHSVVISET